MGNQQCIINVNYNMHHSFPEKYHDQVSDVDENMWGTGGSLWKALEFIELTIPLKANIFLMLRNYVDMAEGTLNVQAAEDHVLFY